MSTFRESALACESGATVIEYALIAGGLSLAIAAVVPGIGASVSGIFAALAGSF